ncbi:hypothetical protein [Simkania negevensis]|uniref:Uncharacterized protein n=1 Tax=Simkania negevensis (strain ATCC VR-1471 / DSM 27360 / Z) TaxID=331113 RepID=F8L703_SIMNZ|nr:hypothetical protein [Simkania negevensis]CCB88517.1 unknown protein [Simkania negevensis Z]
MTLASPAINFGVLERSEAHQLCIVLDTEKLGSLETAGLAQKLRNQNLECLEAKEGNEYSQKFFMARGIIVYAKKHDEQDADHSFGMDLGVTVKQAFDTIKKTFNEQYGSIQIHPLAYENLQRFLTPLQEIGLNVAKEVMPELNGIEDVAVELEDPQPKRSQPSTLPPKPQKSNSGNLFYWMLGGLVILAAFYCVRQFFPNKKG